jgi:hypothetical protein
MRESRRVERAARGALGVDLVCVRRFGVCRVVVVMSLMPNRLSSAATVREAKGCVSCELAIGSADRGGRVNAMAPGMTETEGFASAGLSAESANALGFTLPRGGLAGLTISRGLRCSSLPASLAG